MSRSKLIILLLLPLLLAILYFAARPYLSLEALQEHKQWIDEQAAQRPLLTALAAFLGYVLLTLIPVLKGKSLLAGWLFGFLPGLLLVNTALTVSALIMFLLGRHLLRAIVEQRLSWLIDQLNAGLQGNASTYLLMVRLLHVPYTVTNYAIGATKTSMRRFWWTTQFGLLPGNITFALAGASLPSLAEIQQRGLWNSINLPLLIGLTIVGMLPIAVRTLLDRGDSRWRSRRSTGQRLSNAWRGGEGELAG